MFKASPLPPAPFWQQVFAGWLLVAGCLFLAAAAAACWLLATGFGCFSGSKEGLEFHLLFFLLILGSMLVLGVHVGSHLGTRGCSGTAQRRHLWQGSVLSILSRFRLSLGSQFWVQICNVGCEDGCWGWQPFCYDVLEGSGAFLGNPHVLKPSKYVGFQ